MSEESGFFWYKKKNFQYATGRAFNVKRGRYIILHTHSTRLIKLQVAKNKSEEPLECDDEQ